MKSLAEFIFLFYLRIKVALFRAREEKKVKRILHPLSSFASIDILLKKAYHRLNAYTICKEYLQEKGFSNIHAYGETPLTELFSFLKLCKVSANDHFIDLGCGRGRVAFFVHSHFNCPVTGIDCVPRFITLANQLASTLSNSPSFVCKDMQTTDLSCATIIYFYALCLEEFDFSNMVRKFTTLKKGTKIITVSEDLQTYSPLFKTLASQTASFPWGKGEFFLNELIN